MHDLMTDLRPDLADDKIDLRELFAVLWREKWLIFSLCCVALLLASVYLHKAEPKYTVSMILKPVIEDSTGPNLAGLGGLASLAGVSLPQSGSGECFGLDRAPHYDPAPGNFATGPSVDFSLANYRYFAFNARP